MSFQIHGQLGSSSPVVFVCEFCVQVIVGVYVAALLSQLTRFVESRVERLELASHVDPNTTVIGCQVDFAPFVAAYMHVYFNVYFWFRVVFIHFVPCSALVLLNAALSYAMQAAKRRRQQLLRLNRRQECLRLEVCVCACVCVCAVYAQIIINTITNYSSLGQLSSLRPSISHSVVL